MFCMARAMAACGKRVAALVLVPLTLLGFGSVRTIGVLEDARSIQTAQAHGAMEAYCIDHPENQYIYDISLADDDRAFAVYPDKKPINLFFWGGWEMLSPMQKRQLAANGLTELYAEALLEGDAYLMTAAPNTAGMMDYMQKEYGAVGYEIIAELEEGVLVIRFYR